MNAPIHTSLTLGGLLLTSIAIWLGQFSASAITTGEGDEGGLAAGPDVIVGAIPDSANYGSIASGDTRLMAYAVGTTSCNIGTTNLAWQQFPSTLHPFIPMNLYRFRNGRLEQIGMSWGKHGFCALQETLCGSCTPAGAGCPNALGVGCSDPYTASLNGSQGDLGCRSEVNPSTGSFPSTPNGGMPAAQATIGRRLQIAKSDVDSTYFAPFSIGSIDVTTNTCTTTSPHGLATGMPVTLYASTTTPSAIPGGITAGSTYYAIRTSDLEFRLATSGNNAANGTSLDITSTGAGSITVSPASAGWSIAPSAVDAAADTFTANYPHGFVTGQRVTFLSSGNPGGLSNNAIYYVIVESANSLKLANSAANALAGTAINLTSPGVGQHHISSTFFLAEGQYIHQQDAASGNDNNNASWREATFGPYSASSGGTYSINLTGTTRQQLPAMLAWPVYNPAVSLVAVDVPNDGRFWVGFFVRNNGNGTWRYEYAVQNLNSDRAARAFRIPVPSGVVISNEGFRDVAYHSGDPFASTDWSYTRDNGFVVWSTETYATNPNANALRFATMYNFWFDANTPPMSGAQVGSLGLFKPATDGGSDDRLLSLFAPSAPTALPGDLSGNGTVDAEDLAILLAAWDTPAADLTGDGITGGADLATLLSHWTG